MKIGYDAKRIFHNTTGLGNYSRDLVRILSEYYPENEYHLYNPKKGKVKRLIPNNINVFEILPASYFSKIIPSFWRSKGVVKQLVKDNIDLYHGLTGELPIGIEKTSIKTIVTIHDLIFERYPELYKTIDRKIYFKKFKHAAETAHVIVAISEQTKQDIVDFLKITPEKIKVVYQGCHPVFKEDLTNSFMKKTMRKYQLPDQYLLYVGSMIERKNALSVVKAAAITGDNVVMVGDGRSYFEKIKQYVKDNKLSHKIIFLKGLSMEELGVLYRKAQIFLYPSDFEGFGIPIIEALYSKTPVITGKGSCFPEAGGATTLYIDPLNIEEIVYSIEKIKNNEKMKNEMIHKGFKYAQRFNDDAIAKNMMEIYQLLVS
jgi:glycosyltransferase involved in cell wall biosynthesis